MILLYLMKVILVYYNLINYYLDYLISVLVSYIHYYY